MPPRTSYRPRRTVDRTPSGPCKQCGWPVSPLARNAMNAKRCIVNTLHAHTRPCYERFWTGAF
eukprot:14318573-Alexandrium_andersonii.AAC.1